MKTKLSLSEIGLCLLIPFASLASHTWLPIPPTMVLLFGAIACWVLLQAERPTMKIRNPEFKKIIVVFSLFIAYLFVSQYFMDANFRHYMGAIFAPIYLILILIFSENTSPDFLKKLGEKFILYSLIILSAEAVLRYSNCIFYIIQDPHHFYNFYTFKHGGPMYLVSNAVACHLITLLFFMLWWSKMYGKSMKKQIFLTTVLIALTLSRASIGAGFIGLIYYWLFRNLNWKKSLMALAGTAIFSVATLLILRNFISDFSFQSKFQIFEDAITYYQSASLKNILFGIGFYETGEIMTYYAHNYFLLFLMETGVFGFLFLCATIVALVRFTNGSAMIVLVPFLVQTSMESNTFLPYFYVIMALIITLLPTFNPQKILEK